MSISSESSAESAPQMSAESAPQMSESPPPVTGPPRNLAIGLLKAVRPRQWMKNLLVLLAPVAALGGNVHYDYRKVALKVVIAFLSFSLAASTDDLVHHAPP